MQVRHPEGDDYVDVRGTVVAVDEDGTFEVPDRQAGWLDSWCAANGYDRAAVVVDEADEDEATGFDAEAWLDEDYLDRAAAVREGEVDEHLDAIEAAETSQTVEEAVADRRAELE